MAAVPTLKPQEIGNALRRELATLTLFRVLQAALLALMVFSPIKALIDAPRYPVLAWTISILYLAVALALWLYQRKSRRLTWQVLLGIGVDIVAATLATHALPAATPGIALLLLFNLGAAALFLSLRMALVVAAIAAIALGLEFVWSSLSGNSGDRPFAEVLMFGVSFVAMVTITTQLGRRMQASLSLAAQRGMEVDSLAEVNELIIRRMRSGVLLVDADDHVELANEAALLLLGDVAESGRSLALTAPELADRIEHWRATGETEDSPLRLGRDNVEVQPRFARLLADSGSTLVFLDDASLVSRRAESLTLTAMGRFSASLAHEIRNPLAAINYATQLLEESPDIAEGDRRLLQIIHQQCMRTNGIVESVLGLARRERAQPEHIDLSSFLRRFIEEQRMTIAPEMATLHASGHEMPHMAMVDPRHLQQILTVLVQNAAQYGRMPGETARITVHVRQEHGHAQIEVIDRGPGIPESAASQLFRPFHTTSEHGTGLGLYIARELARANQAQLDYVPLPGGGSCFRLTLSAPHALLNP